MTKDEIWKAFLVDYPHFADGDSVVKLKSRGLQRLLDNAWDEGRDEGHTKGVADGRALESMENAKKLKSHPFGGLFGK